jgi:hypothetical protein
MRNEAFRSACRKLLTSLWALNRYFAGLFVFNGLASFSFRRLHGLFVSNNLAPFFVSPLPSGLADAESRFERFQSVAAPFASRFRLNAEKVRSRLAYEECEPGSSSFLKNNTKPGPASQENVAQPNGSRRRE